MPTSQQAGLPGYFITSGIIVLMSWFMTGCKLLDRFGNKVTTAPPKEQVTGYYRTQPQELTFWAEHGTTVERAAPTHLIPAFLGSMVSNPVGMSLENPATGEGYLVNPFNGNALPITIHQASKAILIGGSTAKVPVFSWTGEKCLREYLVEGTGNYSSDGKGTVLSGATLSGSIQFEVTVVIDFTKTMSNDCNTALTLARDCYLNESQCGGATSTENDLRHRQAQAMFETYIQVGVMTANDIPNLTRLEYKVRYE